MADTSLSGAPDPKDPLLDAMVDQLEEALPPAQKKAYQQIVVAGMKVMFSKETSGLLDQAIEQGKEDLPKAIVKGILQLLSIIYKQSGGKMSPAMAIPAGITLMCYALDYAKKTRGMSISKPMLAAMIKTLAQDGLKMMGIDENAFAKGIEYARDKKQEFEDTGSYPEPGQEAAQAAPPDQAAPQGMVGA